jgi:CheY-like chemotaxis protein/HPt (histidine-containing phosphotransfer) domain-containing protein
MTDFAESALALETVAPAPAAWISKPILPSRLRAVLAELAGRTPQHQRRESGLLCGTAPPARARILLAEDHPVNRELMLAILERLGYPADAVSNGAEAVNALQHRDYDLVLMDGEMPDVDGYEATHRIRRPETGARNPYLPIVAVTANAMPGDRERCLAAGMDDYLPKPVEPEQLARVLARWIAAETPPPPAPAPRAAPADAVFDGQSLLRRLAGNRQLAGRLVAAFLSDTPTQLALLRQQLERHDTAAAGIHAHRLKGAAALLSAAALRGAAFEAEQAANQGSLERLAQLLPAVESEFERLRQTLSGVEWA